MNRPTMRVLPSPEDASKFPTVPPPGNESPSEHFKVHIAGSSLYSIRTTARLAGAMREWERATDENGRARWAAQYLDRWCGAEFERTGIMPAVEPAPAATSPTEPAPPAAALAVAPIPASSGPNPRDHFMALDRDGSVSAALGVEPAQHLFDLVVEWDKAAGRRPFEAQQIEAKYWEEWTAIGATGVDLNFGQAGEDQADTPKKSSPQRPAIADPAKHFKANRHLYPGPIAEALEAIARTWSMTRSDDSGGALSIAHAYSSMAIAWKHSPCPDAEAWLEERRREWGAPAGRPSTPCLCCNGREWWRDAEGPWVCSTCHPPARLELVGDRRPAPHHSQPATVARWAPKMAELIARLEELAPDDLPPSFELRPGVRVADSRRFLDGLKAEVAHGPGGLRARRGVLAADLVALITVVTEYKRPIGFQVKASRPSTERLPERRAGVTPAGHLADLGGYDGASALFEVHQAHMLWDLARLWQRDRGASAAEKWEAQYWAVWAKAQEGRT